MSWEPGLEESLLVGLPGLLRNCSKQEGPVYAALTSHNTAAQSVSARGGMQPVWAVSGSLLSTRAVCLLRRAVGSSCFYPGTG